VFIVERPGLRLTRRFYLAAAIVFLLTGAFPALLMMHVHIDSKTPALSRKRLAAPRAPRPSEIPECDLPPLPGREGPYDYKGYPYYLYPSGDVDGFAGREWWRVSLDEFKRHVDRVTTDRS
jgi:hypothetical protein